MSTDFLNSYTLHLRIFYLCFRAIYRDAKAKQRGVTQAAACAVGRAATVVKVLTS